MCKFFASLCIQNNSSCKILTYIVTQSYNLYFANQTSFKKSVFNFRHRNSFFFNFYNGICTPLKKETSVIIKFNKVCSCYSGRVFNKRRFYIQTAIFTNPKLNTVIRSPDKTVSTLLTVCNSRSLCRTITFHWTEAKKFFCTNGKLF